VCGDLAGRLVSLPRSRTATQTAGYLRSRGTQRCRPHKQIPGARLASPRRGGSAEGIRQLALGMAICTAWTGVCLSGSQAASFICSRFAGAGSPCHPLPGAIQGKDVAKGLLKHPTPNAPVVLVIGGADTSFDDLFFTAGRGLFDRGYPVALADLPGQGITRADETRLSTVIASTPFPNPAQLFVSQSRPRWTPPVKPLRRLPCAPDRLRCGRRVPRPAIPTFFLNRQKPGIGTFVRHVKTSCSWIGRRVLMGMSRPTIVYGWWGMSERQREGVKF
jgi:hypothetical protein